MAPITVVMHGCLSLCNSLSHHHNKKMNVGQSHLDSSVISSTKSLYIARTSAPRDLPPITRHAPLPTLRHRIPAQGLMLADARPPESDLVGSGACVRSIEVNRGACVRSDVAGLASSGPSPLLRVSHGKSREPRASVRPPRPPFLFGPATRRADTTIALIARAGARSRSACEVGRSIENSFPGRDRLAVNRVCAIRGAAARAPRREGGPPPRRLRRAGWASGRRSGARGP